MAGSDTPRRILIGTTNPSKFQSLSRRFFQFSGVACVSPSDLALQMEIPETGATMAENAQLKARAFHRRTGLAVLSADSGLFFRELPWTIPGSPAPTSAGWGAEFLTDEEMLQYYSGLAGNSGCSMPATAPPLLGWMRKGGMPCSFRMTRDADFFRAFGFHVLPSPREAKPRLAPGQPEHGSIFPAILV